MPAKRDDQGRRSIQVEVEVPGTPEEVWRAIATADGVSAWFVPTTSEDDPDGVPRKIIANFGPGMESISTVTAWDPPRSFSAESADLGPDAPTVATQWIVEARAGGTCIVRVVHSLFASTDDWDSQLEGWESGWPGFFRILRIYLAHFSGQPFAALQFTNFHPGPRAAAWESLMAGLGGRNVAAGQQVQSTGGAPPLKGTAAHVGPPEYPEELLLRVEGPAPGIAHLFAMEMGGKVLLSMRLLLYGETAADAAAQAEPAWQAWLSDAFPDSGPSM